MEVCGTHTHAIGRGGIRALMPANVELVSGPGCPVCVTSQRDVERMLLLAQVPGVTVCTFGDMLRVPGLSSSLGRERSRGADVHVVYSALDALSIAREEPSREVAFLAVGFETTSPGVASVVHKAREEGIGNLSLRIAQTHCSGHGSVLSGECLLDGFLTPGHVGDHRYDAYEDLAAILPCVATGFEPWTCLRGLPCCSAIWLKAGQARSRSIRGRCVPVGIGVPGTRLCRYSTVGREWRGLGVIPASGLKLREEYAGFDAVSRFNLPEIPATDPPGCRCGDVLKGLIQPKDCACSGAPAPPEPAGACMVSSEGSARRGTSMDENRFFSPTAAADR